MRDTNSQTLKSEQERIKETCLGFAQIELKIRVFSALETESEDEDAITSKHFTCHELYLSDRDDFDVDPAFGVQHCLMKKLER